MTKPDISCLALPFAFRPTITFCLSKNLKSLSSPSITSLPFQKIGKTLVLRKDSVTTLLKTPSAKITLSKESIDRDSLPGEFKGLCQKIGIECDIKDSNTEVIWEKYSRLCVLATVTAAAQMALGEIQQDKHWGPVLVSLINEVAKISTAYSYISSNSGQGVIAKWFSELLSNKGIELYNSLDSEINFISYYLR